MSESTSIHILCMEDDRDAARLFKIRLEEKGYRVDLAENGQTGLEMYQAGCYDVVAIDQHMPHQDGLSVLRTLATFGPLPPTVMVTGTGSEKIAVDALKLGASDYIVKDVDGGYLELLPNVINQVLQKQSLLQEKLQAVAALEQRNKDLALLNQAGQSFTATLDLQELVQLLLQVATRLVKAEGSSVWLWDEIRPGWLVCQVVYNKGMHHSPLNLRLKPGEGVAGWVAERGQSLIVPNVETDTRFSAQIDSQTGFRTTSLITVPLHGREGLVGVLEIVNKIEGKFTRDDLVMVEALAAPAAIAIDNARMVNSLRQRALELQERNEELDAFAHTVAHDLKTPLIAIMGYADILMNFTVNISLPKEIKQNLQSIYRAGHKMDNIIQELLLFAGIRQLDVTPKPIKMKEIIREAHHRLELSINESNAQITLPHTWPEALGYGPWIEEVWVNYISNAIKYGGEPPQIELGATPQEDGTVQFWIKDNGAGLTQKEQAQLFVPFIRLSQVRVQGHGLGLSIVRQIVEKLGGSVGIKSQPGYGSTFFFTLPAV